MNNLRYKPLPKELFFVRVPLIATYSDIEMNTLGLPINMINNQPDHTTYNTMVPVYLPLDRIIDIYISGYPIKLIDHESLDRIYVILDQYVRGLNDNDNFELNMPGVVEERLYDIEKFAAEIFDNNKVDILRKLISFKHGYDANVNIMHVNTPVVNKQPVNHVVLNNTDSYQSVLSNPNLNSGYGYGMFGGQPTLNSITASNTSEPSVRDAFRVNPNKPELSNTTYVNNNLPEINFSLATRTKTQIRLKQ